MKNIRCLIPLLFSLFAILPASLSAGTRFDSLCAKSDVMVSGRVIQHRTDPILDHEHEVYCEIDFVVFMLCAEPSRYPELLKVLQPGDTLKGIAYYTASAYDTVHVKSWLQLPLMRDTTKSSGWRLTDSNFRSGFFADTLHADCHHLINYIHNEYGVVQQKFTHKALWGYTSFITLDGTLREEWKYKWRGKTVIHVTTEYFPDGRKKSRVRTKESLDRHGVRVIAWTFRANGKLMLHRQKTGIYD